MNPQPQIIVHFSLVLQTILLYFTSILLDKVGPRQHSLFNYYYYYSFLASYLTWEFTWLDTFDVIKKKVLSDFQTHGYMTSIDDIMMSWKDYDWYNTGVNPIKAVTFNAERDKILF